MQYVKWKQQYSGSTCVCKRAPLISLLHIISSLIDTPILIIAACHSGDVEGIKKVIEEVDYASREFGAFHIVNHGIAWDVVQNARKAMLRVFYLPLEQKMKAKRDFVRNYSGFGSGSMLCPSKQWNEAFQFLMDDASAPVIIDEYGAKLFGEGTEEKEFFW